MNNKPVEANMKSCCACKEIKPHREFNNDKKAKDGKQSRCRNCIKDYHNSHKAEQKERDRRRWHRNKCLRKPLSVFALMTLGSRNTVCTGGLS